MEPLNHGTLMYRMVGFLHYGNLCSLAAAQKVHNVDPSNQHYLRDAQLENLEIR